MKTKTNPKKIRDQISRLSKQLRSIESKKKANKNKSYVGRYFRYRNSYGSDDGWWLYVKVTACDRDGNLVATCFEKTAHDEYRFQRDHCYMLIGSCEEIGHSIYEFHLKDFQQQVLNLSKSLTPTPATV